MELQTRYVGSTPAAKDEQLRTALPELTIEDCEHYEKVGWKYCTDEYRLERYLPELAPPVYFGEKPDSPSLWQLKTKTILSASFSKTGLIATKNPS